MEKICRKYKEIEVVKKSVTNKNLLNSTYQACDLKSFAVGICTCVFISLLRPFAEKENKQFETCSLISSNQISRFSYISNDLQSVIGRFSRIWVGVIQYLLHVQVHVVYCNYPTHPWRKTRLSYNDINYYLPSFLFKYEIKQHS